MTARRLVLLLVAAAAASFATSVSTASAAPTGPGCTKPLHATPQRSAADSGLWLDRCGKAYYVEQKAPGAPTATSGAPAPAPLSETFLLESKPGSARTIYLDFNGGTVSGTAWQNGATMAVEPFSITAPADTAFTDAELTEVQRAWQIVAEDYAPFDVNVTTRDLGVAAIDRTSSADLNYGAHVIVTRGGPVYDGCQCGGVAYVGVFNTAGSAHMYYQPAWVFTAGVGTGGKNIGEAAAHEVGHQFGLKHDGTASAAYYSGSAPWAPIMGVGYYQPVTQWSRGEYSGANNAAQDDLAVIATGAPLRTDDHGPASAPSTLGSTPADGVISARTDTDAFRFTAAGSTTVTVAPAPGLPNLDVRLTVLNSAGATVATVDPAVARVSASAASGLGATWTATLPSTPASYTAVVDGTGTGNPLTAGLYSDYASLGHFRISLSTQATVTPLAAVTVPAQSFGGVLKRAFTARLTASGGDGTYTWTAGAVPPGLTLSSTGVLSGTPTKAGKFTFAATARSAGQSGTGTITVTVARR